MFTTYIIGCLALIIKPGPDLMCTLATALSCGKVRASTLMAGLILGCWLWVLLLTAGVASIFIKYPSVMTAIQIVGIVYIGYLAFGAFKDAWTDFRRGNDGALNPASAKGWRLVVRGILMSMSNPLTILFFLAFLLVSFIMENQGRLQGLFKERSVVMHQLFCRHVCNFFFLFLNDA